jgi:hypothetical protein
MKWFWVPLGLSLGASLMSLNCEGPLPNYSVPDTMLRLIPEVGSVGEEGGPVFVLVELQQPEDKNSKVIVYARAKGATAEALPGPVLCEKSGGSGGGGGGGSGGGGGESPGGTSADLVLPDISLLLAPLKKEGDVNYRNTRQTGFLVNVPQGNGDVQLAATVYSHEGDVTECEPAKKQILAIATARIERKKPAAEADAGTGGGGGGAGGMGGGGMGGGGGTGGGGMGGGGGTGGADAGTDAGTDGG